MAAPPHIVLIGTGGTISAVAGGDGLIATRTPDELLAPHRGDDVTVSTRTVLNVDSAAITPDEQYRLLGAVLEALDDPTVTGVVVTHGTDSLEESAILLDLAHRDRRRVVLTGAQLPADSPIADGPANLTAALRLAATGPGAPRPVALRPDTSRPDTSRPDTSRPDTSRPDTSRPDTSYVSHPGAEIGVSVAFGGQVLPARGLFKSHLTDAAAFDCVAPALHRVLTPDWDRALLTDPAARSAALAAARVDIIALHPGVDPDLLAAHVAAGARALVLIGLGSGNTHPGVVDSVRRVVSDGTPVVVSTRVPHGAVHPTYGGGGGGVDLVRAGATPSTWLRPPQVRMALQALLISDPSGFTVGDFFARTQPM
ncbi:asparaginase domain-containing protein [Williamsia sp. CHRR-6]|uniref:asparaginase domain-containing protein n=1 Tax=Williamsia sp. CHRR-6 TaxID=2835871 RepID=UPI001BD9FF1C|nr:asparaginase domain-containing protein [Williamsia sp. CHRR-6]MBT0565249.1 asparaginase [Williamsia sp. CHRR-6]